MSEWQPIETAPRDSFEILVFVRDTNEQFVAYRLKYGGYAFASCSCGQAHTLDNPTHWMPLPQPPEEGEADE